MKLIKVFKEKQGGIFYSSKFFKFLIWLRLCIFLLFLVWRMVLDSEKFISITLLILPSRFRTEKTLFCLVIVASVFLWIGMGSSFFFKVRYPKNFWILLISELLTALVFGIFLISTGEAIYQDYYQNFF
jgi:hypothetical protein